MFKRFGARDPDLGGAAVAVVSEVALEASGVDERGEGAVDLAGFFVAAEEIGLGAAAGLRSSVWCGGSMIVVWISWCLMVGRSQASIWGRCSTRLWRRLW